MLTEMPSHREVASRALAARSGLGAGLDIVSGLVQALGQLASSVPAIEAASGLKSATAFQKQQADAAAAISQANAQAAESLSTSGALKIAAGIGTGGLVLALLVYALRRRRRA